MKSRNLVLCTVAWSFLFGSPAFAQKDTSTRAASQDLAKTWNGTLVAGGASVPLVFHLEGQKDGAFTATLDSPAQGAFGLPVDDFIVKGRDVTATMSKMGALYRGTLNDNATEMKGTWSQGGASLPLVMRAESFAQKEKPGSSAAVSTSTLALSWSGAIEANGQKLPMIIHLKPQVDGTFQASADSPDQGAFGLPVDRFSVDKDQVSFEIKLVGGRYQGVLNAAKDEIKGTWDQGGGPTALNFRAAAGETNRPQEPKGPFSYNFEEVTFRNPKDDVTLAGTLTTPKNGGAFPAVLLLSGSGSQDRNETVFDHKPFLLISDVLTKKGFAVLRWDDRGVGGSSKGNPNATAENLAGDVRAAMAFLKNHKSIDTKRIGLLGHSEGGSIAVYTAARFADVAFVVMLAGPAQPGSELLMFQNEWALRASGLSQTEITRLLAIVKKAFAIAVDVPDTTEAEKQLRPLLKDLPGSSPEQDAKQLKLFTHPAFRFLLAYDAAQDIAEVKVPLLALFGEKDMQVPAKPNAEALRKALAAAGHTNSAVVVLPGHNHLFQECKTGLISEYGQIEQTLSPLAQKTISDWLVAYEQSSTKR